MRGSCLLLSLIVLGICGGLGAEAATQPLTPEDMPLPQPLGAISDYGAQLGRNTRAQLQSLIADLEDKVGVRVYVLITLLDPFGSPSTLAEEIWDAWELGAKGKAVLLLFVREGEPWAFRWRAHPELNPRLRAPEVLELWARVEGLVENRKIAQAVRTGVEGLHRFLVGSPPRVERGEALKEETGKPSGLPIWAYVVGGILGLLALLAGAVAYALVWLCPECGARLARSPLPYGYGMRAYRRARGVRRAWVYYCRRCGYRRIGSGRERGRGPRRL